MVMDCVYRWNRFIAVYWFSLTLSFDVLELVG